NGAPRLMSIGAARLTEALSMWAGVMGHLRAKILIREVCRFLGAVLKSSEDLQSNPGSAGALSWELRAAMGLAQLLAQQGRPDDARRILASVYDGFTEGFETADLRSAREIPSALRGGA